MGTATGIELTLLSAVAVHAEIEELLPRFRQQEGTEVKANYDVNPAVAKRVMDGGNLSSTPPAFQSHDCSCWPEAFAVAISKAQPSKAT